MLRRLAPGGLALGALLSIAACDAPSDPVPWAWADVPNPRVLLVSHANDPTGNAEMFVLTKDGEVAPVLDGTYVNANPSITGDGELIAFHRYVTPGDFSSLELFMLDVDTGVETRLTNDAFANAAPKWNGDGTRLVYTSWRTGDTPSEANLFVLDVTDGSITEVTADPDHEDSDPIWCGNDAFAFKSTRGTGEKYKEQIHLAGLDGSDVRQLSATTGWQSDHDPRCSPDGQWVYFYRYEATRPWTEQGAQTWDEVYPVNIWRVDREGNQEKLTDCEFFCAGPVPSDDGSVLYVQKEFLVNASGELVGTTAQLMIMDADGSHPRELLPPSVYAEHTSTLDWIDW